MHIKQKYKVIAEHRELKKSRIVRSSEKNIAEQKAKMVESIWNKKWQKKISTEEKKRNAWANARTAKDKKNIADELTQKAQDDLKYLKNIFNYGLIVDHRVEFDSLAEFIEITKPVEPSLKSIPEEPCESDPQFVPDFKIMERLLPSKHKKKIEELKEKFKECHLQWEHEKSDIQEKNKIAEEKYRKNLENWETEKNEIINAIHRRKQGILNGEAESIVDFADMLLSVSHYPDSFPQDFEIDYDTSKKQLIVQYLFPSIEDLNIIKEFKYNKKKDKLEEVYASESLVNDVYDDLLYEIAIRTVYELFSNDTHNNIENIVFTGWVKFGIGDENEREAGETKNCIMSIVVDRKKFMSLNIEKMNARSIFSKFNGVVGGKLHELNKVIPYLELNFER